MSRLPVEGHKDRFVLTEWLVKRWIEKSGESRYTTDPYSAWVVEEKKVVRLMGYLRTMSGSISLFHSFLPADTAPSPPRSSAFAAYTEIPLC